MLRIFIGFDTRETVAYHVLAHSIQARASRPISITPIDLRHLGGAYTRPLTQQSTAFTYSRFLVPWLCGFQGYALFMDCDMLVKADIHDLFRATSLPERSREHTAVWVCQHDYEPRPGPKFLGQPQVAYPRKNWSSVMLFNNIKCKALTPHYVNTAPPVDLHRFAWLKDSQIGPLPLEWGWLVGEYDKNPEAKILHYTRGGPWFSEFSDCDHADEWWQEYEQMKRLGD